MNDQVQNGNAGAIFVTHLKLYKSKCGTSHKIIFMFVYDITSLNTEICCHKGAKFFR